MDCSDCKDLYKERKQETPCDSCPINWLTKEAEAMGFSLDCENKTDHSKEMRT